MGKLAGPICIQLQMVCHVCKGADFVMELGYSVCVKCGHATPATNECLIEDEVVM